MFTRVLDAVREEGFGVCRVLGHDVSRSDTWQVAFCPPDVPPRSPSPPPTRHDVTRVTCVMGRPQLLLSALLYLDLSPSSSPSRLSAHRVPGEALRHFNPTLTPDSPRMGSDGTACDQDLLLKSH